MKKTRQVRIPLADDVYATAKAEAARCGFPCVGTKVRHDIEQHYRRIAGRARGAARKDGGES
jgi:hypothetical protein